ncbi:MAG: NF038122 family metalloprotease [Phycisphaerae bacterium]|nr:NF038122 family metalloprotease [Phycisphaerae bacterium]
MRRQPIISTRFHFLLLCGAIAFAMAMGLPQVTYGALAEGAANSPYLGPPIETDTVQMPADAGGDLLQYGRTQTSDLGSFSTNINPGATLAGNAPALAAFNRAAQQWENWIADPITVNIDADMAPLGPGILGSASSVLLSGTYTLIRDAVVADAAGEADDGIAAFIPTAAQFSAFVPSGFSLSGMSATKANLKALGFTGLDAQFGATDATITFSSNFAFDFDNSDGVTAGTWDFETVAAHELGHALGFTSEVDWVDWLLNNSLVDELYPQPLDLFRFENDVAGRDPATNAEFTSFSRWLVPGSDAVTDQIAPSLGGVAAENRMSTGKYFGDGRQASHWKDNSLTGTLIGIMDPTFPSGTIVPVNNSDLRALDLIGYEILVPEPATLALLLLGGLALLSRRR